MNKSIKVFMPILAAAFIFTGCSNSEPPKAQPEPAQASQPPSTPSNTTTDQQQQQPEDQQAKQATGEYVGQIDSNSVEITVDGSTNAFVLNEESQKIIETLKTGSKVSIVYNENEHGQLILNKIELAK